MSHWSRVTTWGISPSIKHRANDNALPYDLRDDPMTSSMNEVMRNESLIEGKLHAGSPVIP